MKSPVLAIKSRTAENWIALPVMYRNRFRHHVKPDYKMAKTDQMAVFCRHVPNVLLQKEVADLGLRIELCRPPNGTEAPP
ncbi:MAG: hypothetical protein CMQ16_02125 [Gammaproteobacteria bacterium]|nr:hypothetical protein [Gammaproteobacteria bacterium]